MYYCNASGRQFLRVHAFIPVIPENKQCTIDGLLCSENANGCSVERGGLVRGIAGEIVTEEASGGNPPTIDTLHPKIP